MSLQGANDGKGFKIVERSPRKALWDSMSVGIRDTTRHEEGDGDAATADENDGSWINIPPLDDSALSKASSSMGEVMIRLDGEMRD